MSDAPGSVLVDAVRREMFMDSGDGGWLPIPVVEEPTAPIDSLGDVDVRVLTVRQPWATALVSGGKDVENRQWHTDWRGWVLVHAGLVTETFISADLRRRLHDPSTLPKGVVLGAIHLDDVRSPVRPCCSVWAARGQFHWIHDPSRAIPLVQPVAWKGAQGLCRAPVGLLAKLPAWFVDRLRGDR